MRPTALFFLVLIVAMLGSAVTLAQDREKSPKYHSPLECQNDGVHLYVADVKELPNGRLDLPAGYAVTNVAFRHQEDSTGKKYDELCVTLRPLGSTEAPAAPSTHFLGQDRLKVTIRELPPLPEESPRPTPDKKKKHH